MDLDKEELKATRNMQNSVDSADKTADEMFEELGYEETYHNFYSSELYDTTINFKTIYKELYINGNLGMQELKAINKKVKELGWND